MIILKNSKKLFSSSLSDKKDTFPFCNIKMAYLCNKMPSKILFTSVETVFLKLPEILLNLCVFSCMGKDNGQVDGERGTKS